MTSAARSSLSARTGPGIGGWRPLAGACLLLLAILLGAIEGLASLPAFDSARLLLAANGSIVRGMVVVAVAGVALALLAAAFWRRRRVARFARVLAAGIVIAAAANLVYWQRGLTVDDIAFVSDGTSLEGTLMRPTGIDRPPVVVIVHGSVPFVRGFYAVWGRALVRDDVAVLVYDKRGTGRSGGTLPISNNASDYLVQLGRDAAQAVDALSRRQDVDLARISLLGISQGGWTVPVAASLRPDVFRIALLSGPVATTAEEGAFSDATGERNAGRSDDLAAIRNADGIAAKVGGGGFDPRPYLEGSRVPGRWYFGDRDRSIPVALSTARIAKLQANGNPVDAVVLADADHLLLDRSGLPIGFKPGLLHALADWLSGNRVDTRSVDVADAAE